MRVTLLDPPSLSHFLLIILYFSDPIIALTGLLCFWLGRSGSTFSKLAATSYQLAKCQAKSRYIFSPFFALTIDMAISNISLYLNLTLTSLASLHLPLSF